MKKLTLNVSKLNSIEHSANRVVENIAANLARYSVIPSDGLREKIESIVDEYINRINYKISVLVPVLEAALEVSGEDDHKTPLAVRNQIEGLVAANYHPGMRDNWSLDEAVKRVNDLVINEYHIFWPPKLFRISRAIEAAFTEEDAYFQEQVLDKAVEIEP